MKKRLDIAIMVLMTMTLSLFAIPTVVATPPAGYDHLVVDTIGEPMDLDPAWSYDTSSAELLMNVYETLLWFNRTNMDSYVPVVATEWTGEVINQVSPEGLTWVNRWYFKIRTGIKFHNASQGVTGEGATLTPQDVEYSFERMLITDASTGPAWMIFEPLVAGYWMGDINATLDDLGSGSVNATTGWNTLCDEVVDHAIESNSTHVWFNLVMTYEPWLQIVAQQWGSILNQAWCVALGDWPGMSVGDGWVDYHDPVTSPLYSADTSAPGPNLDAALGTGPYMLDYWNKGAGGAWSIVKNPDYWRGWSVPYHPTNWAPEKIIRGHVDRYTSNYVAEWATRRSRFLGGVSDFTYVPREYMDQVQGEPGIECFYPLPLLSCSACFMSYIVADSTTRLGVVQANGTFNALGAPPNIFNDTDTRLGFAHLFDFDTYLYASFLDEAISPVTPIVPGLTYYDPSIGVPEQPAPADTRKEYGITGEPANQKAYDLDLAKYYLSQAWGGALWSTGFTMDLVYNEGNTARLMAATLVQDALNQINAENGTSFTTNIVSIPWSTYKIEWAARQLPYFIVGWLADYPDAHNFAHPFMHSIGAFSRWQGINGVTAFPNDYCDGLIEAGIATIDPVERQGNYTIIQQYYVDECPGWVLAQATGRHWQRDWVQGWYYNPIYPGNYVYDFWKAWRGDINTDGEVDVFDKVIVGAAFGATISYNPLEYLHQPPDFTGPCPYCPHPDIADVNGDGIVDVFDKVIVGFHFGEGGG